MDNCQPALNERFGGVCLYGGEGSRLRGIAAMRRFLPHSLAFLALHVLFIGAAVTVAAFN